MDKSFHVSVNFEGTRVPLLEGESVLDAILRSGFELPHSCKQGLCQTCLLRTDSKQLSANSQKDVKSSLASQGYFLACQCFPQCDLNAMRSLSSDVAFTAVLSEKKVMSQSIARLRFRLDEPLDYFSGQHINLYRSDQQCRSYSLASVPVIDDFIELHVQRKINGAISSWLMDDFQEGQSVKIQGPLGHSYYVKGKDDSPLLLVGTGTGLAPLYSIVRNALMHSYAADVHLVHGSRYSEGAYLQAELQGMSNHYDQLSYYPCISKGSTKELGMNAISGRVDAVLSQKFPHLEGWKVYICGNPSMVKSVQRYCFLAGAKLEDIYIDPFEMQDLRKIMR